jgi:hypothetical protein
VVDSARNSYLADHDPWRVYGGWVSPYRGYYLAPAPSGLAIGLGLGFAAGISIGLFAHYGWGYHHWEPNWHGGVVVYNHNTYISRSTTVYNRGNFGGYNRGVYEHEGRGVPSNFHPTVTHETASFGHGPNVNRPATGGFARPQNDRPSGIHPEGVRPEAVRPQAARPQVEHAQAPRYQQAPQPRNEGTGTRPQFHPAPQERPAPQSRPAPQARPEPQRAAPQARPEPQRHAEQRSAPPAHAAPQGHGGGEHGGHNDGEHGHH